jgi:N-acetylneuraminic acid mutarotase
VARLAERLATGYASIIFREENHEMFRLNNRQMKFFRRTVMKNLKKQVSFLVMLALTFAVVPGCRAQVATDGQKKQVNLARDGVVSSIQSMTAKRAAHTATLLDNGKVLIAGGFVANGSGLSSVELFDPATNAFTSAQNLSVPRASHTATRLPNGKILIAGGYNGDYLSSAEIFDPATNRFTPAGRMTTARSGHVAVLLNDGKVLLAGGVGTGWTFLADAEIYDPQTDTFTATGAMTTARESHTATLLNDGKVLITGGHRGRRANITIYASAEIYNPANGTFAAAGNLTVKRHKHDAVRLADGRVLIVGGSDERDGDGAYRNAEVFNPANGSFTTVKNNMNTARYKLQGTAILLKSGKVLIAGGANRAEVFDPATDSFSLTEGEMGTKRLFATATLLKNGQVLITGGYTDGPVVSANAWIYRA